MVSCQILFTRPAPAAPTTPDSTWHTSPRRRKRNTLHAVFQGPPAEWRHPVATSSSPSLVPIPTHNAGLFSALAQPDTEAQEEEALFDQREGHHVPRLHPVLQGRQRHPSEGGPLGHPRSLQFWEFFKLVMLFLFFCVTRLVDGISVWVQDISTFLSWFTSIHNFMFSNQLKRRRGAHGRARCVASWAHRSPRSSRFPGKLPILILFMCLISLAVFMGFWECSPSVSTFCEPISTSTCITALSHFSTMLTSGSPGQKTFLSLLPGRPRSSCRPLWIHISCSPPYIKFALLGQCFQPC